MVVSTSAGIGKGAYRRLLESRRFMRFLVALTVALVLVGTAAAAGPRIVGIGEQKDREDAKAHVGDTLVITLGANRSTGYSWKVAAFNRSVLRLNSSGYVPGHPPLVPGASGIAVIVFKVLARGTTLLKLNYVSAGTPKKVGKTFSVKINVFAPGV
jgi:inhibitor of cysteine peptidase